MTPTFQTAWFTDQEMYLNMLFLSHILISSQPGYFGRSALSNANSTNIWII